jgi:Uma2 family endonuclease
MHMKASPAMAGAIVYPERDGKPMADNTKQARWMAVLFGNLCALFHRMADVFVAMDLLWYPEEGHPEVRSAPDVFVVFGRPKGDRGSYRQWEEEGVPVTVVFEILSPGNSGDEIAEKFVFYEEHGVEEYYLFNPDRNRLHVFLRQGHALIRVRGEQSFVSPRLGIRFDLSGAEMVVYYPDDRRFLSFEELEAERIEAEQRAKKAEQRAEKAEHRAARLAELGRKARRGEASAEELQELERLEEQAAPPAP